MIQVTIWKVLYFYAAGQHFQWQMAVSPTFIFCPSKRGEDLSDPRFKPIIDSVLFTKWFALTYHIVIIAILFFFTFKNCLSKFRNNAILVKMVSDNTVRQSSDREDIGISVLPPPKASVRTRRWMQLSNEEIPLISKENASRLPKTISCGVKAFLMYQPQPIPVVMKSFPANETSILILAFVSLNLFFIFFRCIPRREMLFVFADRVGALFAANLPLLYLLAAKNQPIVWLTGYSYEQLNILHRRQGEMLCIFALIHCTGMMFVWYSLLRSEFNLWSFLTEKGILPGLMAFIAYETLYFTSLGSFRKQNYEIFLVLHVTLQFVALILLFFHHPRSRVYVVLSLAIVVVDRIVYRLILKTRKIRANLSILEDENTVLLSANWQLSVRSWFPRNIKFGWKPAEHIFVTIPSLSRKYLLQSHPFTIASAAPRLQDGHAWLDLIIRAQDGFSKDLLNFAKSHSSVNLYIDGPYGSQHAVEMLERSQTAIIVAGGSGIAVAYPLVWSLATSQKESNPNKGNVEDSLIGPTCTKQIHLVWVVREPSHFSWLGETRLSKLRRFGVQVHALPPTVQDGRPDVAAYIQPLLESTWQYDRLLRVGVVCSGPDSMNLEVRNACAAMVKRGGNVNVTIEKFGW